MSCYVNAKFTFPVFYFDCAFSWGLEVSDFVFSVRQGFVFQFCTSLYGFTCLFIIFGCFLNMSSKCFLPVSTGVREAVFIVDGLMIKPEPAYCTVEIQDFPQKCQNPGFLGCGRQENLFLPPVLDYMTMFYPHDTGMIVVILLLKMVMTGGWFMIVLHTL
jgi:hypothetical protein